MGFFVCGDLHFPLSCSYCGRRIGEAGYAASELVMVGRRRVVRDICRGCMPHVVPFWEWMRQRDDSADLPADFIGWSLSERGVDPRSSPLP